MIDNEENIENMESEEKEISQEILNECEEDLGIEQETQEVIEIDEKQVLQQKYDEMLDKYQRCFAEFDNFRKRTIKEKASMFDDGVKNTVEKLLPVIDNFERAIAAQADKAGDDPFFAGIQMIVRQLQEYLTSMGVEEIKAVGEKFDPNLHSAVAHEDNEEYGENEITIEMLKGYKYKDKVIRHSMVKVAN